MQTLCKSLLRENPIPLHLLSQLLDFQESCRPAVWFAPLHFRNLQSCLIQQVAFNKGSYHSTVTLDAQAQEELKWWIWNIKQVNGSPICLPIGRNGCDFRRLQIGVGCYMWQSVHQRALVDSGKCPSHQYIGAKGNVSGSANVSESPVELISETSLRQHNGDSVYKQPGRHSFPYSQGSNTRSVELVHSTNILITAEHLPGISNTQADQESRTFTDMSDWKLQPQLIQPFLKESNTDLFATRLTNQLPCYASWRPDPHAVVTDAFSINWSRVKRYAFPPFNLIPRTLTKVIKDNANLLLAALVWQTQHWWPMLLQLTVQLPVLLPSSPSLLQDPSNPKAIHPMFPRL